MKKVFILSFVLFSFLAFPPMVQAQSEETVRPDLERVVPGVTQMGFMEPASQRMERIVSFHDDLLLWIITAITIFVLGCLSGLPFVITKKPIRNQRRRHIMFC